MPLSVVSDPTKNLTTDGGTVVVESSSLDSSIAYAELQGPDARKLAIANAAQRGVPDPRINNTVVIYPVDGEGKEISDPVAQKIAAYRGDIPITRRLV